MARHENVVYSFTIEQQATHFFDVVLSNYLRGPGKGAGVRRAWRQGCAVVIELECARRDGVLAVLDFLANHNGGVREEGMGGAAVPVEERPYPPQGPRVLLARAVV